MSAIEISNKVIYDASPALGHLMQKKFPVMVSYKLAKIGQLLKTQFELIEQVRNSLIEKYGEPGPNNKPIIYQYIDKKKNGKTISDGNGNPVKEPNPNFDLFNDEFKNVLAEKVKLNIEKVRLPENVAATCDKCKHNMDRPLEIEPSILMPLDLFIEVYEAKTKEK